MKVDTTLRALHAINTAHQEIEFLQQVRNMAPTWKLCRTHIELNGTDGILPAPCFYG